MSRFARLTDYMGANVAVNPAHVTEIHERIGTLKGCVDILMINCTPGNDETVLTVKGTFDEIVELLNGEPGGAS